MKKRVILILTVVSLAVAGTIYGFTTKTDSCPHAGTPECPEYQNCPKKGQADCPISDNCPLKGTPDYVKVFPDRG